MNCTHIGPCVAASDNDDFLFLSRVILAMRCNGQGLRLSDQSPTAVARAIIANPQYFSR